MFRSGTVTVVPAQAPTDQFSAAGDGRFASLVTNTYVSSATTPTRFDVIDSALCEGMSA
jgi:hypothetical protein